MPAEAPARRFVPYEDPRNVLAKMIYRMTERQQRKFRASFPTGFADSQVEDAIQLAKTILKRR